MKKQLWALFLFTFSTLLFTACLKDQTDTTDGLQQPDVAQTGKFSKPFTIHDSGGQNSLSIQVSSDNESLLDELTAEQFTMTALTDAETTPENTAAAAAPAAAVAPDNTNAIHVTVLEAHLAPGVKGYALSTHTEGLALVQSRVAVDWWYHNNNGIANGGITRNRKTNLYSNCSNQTFTVEGSYLGFWPYWIRYAGGFTGTGLTTGWKYTNNLSVHVVNAPSCGMTVYYY